MPGQTVLSNKESEPRTQIDSPKTAFPKLGRHVLSFRDRLLTHLFEHTLHETIATSFPGQTPPQRGEAQEVVHRAVLALLQQQLRHAQIRLRFRGLAHRKPGHSRISLHPTRWGELLEKEPDQNMELSLPRNVLRFCVLTSASLE